MPSVHPLAQPVQGAQGPAWLLDLDLTCSLAPGPEPCDPTGLSAGAWCAEMGVTGGIEQNGSVQPGAWVTWRSRDSIAQ